ncbi:hypothetical protein SAMN05444007_105240 [Cribrihabitans marinus]|uniref:Type II secretion system protein GspE N-terminal domain-containing protein n=1 Tax=Cribrihabitans marinus TaxID=1227549 RepID=A0A1H6ZXG4_9RHOB|nr:glycosyltransferase [Cribrihabitans marinus]GGH30105.1 glycosyl transferase [Cribrihabitans marinus]SEJ56317.1 hypothetical protein SAMN05444007_105240 [Cribrihabitans marinus]
MSDQKLNLATPLPAAVPARSRLPLGRHLVESGAITQDQLVQALRMQLHLNAPLGEILEAEGWVAPDQVTAALAGQHGIDTADLATQPPPDDLCDLLPCRDWLDLGALPWQRIGPLLLVATSRPDRFQSVRDRLADPASGLTPVPVFARERDIHAALSRAFGPHLAQCAETRVALRFSCRDWHAGRRFSAVLVALVAVAAACWAPVAALAVLLGLGLATLLLFSGLRGCALIAQMLNQSQLLAPQKAQNTPAEGTRLPRVSVMVPLYKEREIAGALIRRLTRLTYPKALLEVVLVLEEHDAVTQDTLARTDLPGWMRVVTVPALSGLTTKPRAMNYALDFCRGEIIGVWDAEDAPLPDQIETVVGQFEQAGEDVACLQGILDFYNPRTNWRARCFTIEYASWFRIILPGIARLGLVVPLGGTTLFFRRDVLEKLGGWDAHNVTEDADLGVRLSRAGYRTEMIGTVTYEEANHRAWPWVRQRSRWLKGFMVTYLVHMRAPLQLLRDLGLARFLGFQAFFLGTLGQFLLAPVLWSLWLAALGMPHPLVDALPPGALTGTFAVFAASELLAFLAGLCAVSGRERRFLLPFVPTMPLYFPLGVLAAYKALWEMAFRPFFWDKTQHGQAAEDIPPA